MAIIKSMKAKSIRMQRTDSTDNLSFDPAFQVIKRVKSYKRGGSDKLTHLALHILTKQDGFVLNRPDAVEMTNDGSSKYPRRQKISQLSTVVRAASGTVLHFRSTVETELILDFMATESCDICCRLLFAANKNIEFLDEGETWKEPGKIVEYASQAGRRNQGSVTSRIGAAFSGSKVILRLHLVEKRLELVWGSRHKRYDASNLPIETNWTVQSKFPSNPAKVKILVPSLDYSSGILDMEFYFPSPSLKLKFVGHLRAAMIPNISITKLRRSGLELCGVRGPELRVWCGTWNCGDTPSPGPKELSKWINAQGKYDVYAIGFQECDAKGFKQWVADCKGAFTSSGFAVDEICSVSLWGIHLVVLVKRSLSRLICDVRTDSCACGFANIAGNKGGVGCAFCFNDSTEIAFICSHLAARAKRVTERGDDYKNIAGSMKNLLSHRGTDFLHQTRHVFWLGDLNYRINLKDGTGMDTQGEYEKVLRLIAAEKCHELYEHDQLLQQLQMKNGSFPYFKESELTFAPTYRMNKGEVGYSNKRFQAPSWTDRILVRSVCGYEEKVQQLSYEGHHDMMQSDHRPVSATYNISTCLPYINLSSSKSVVNREKCDILFSDLCVEMHDPDSLASNGEAVVDDCEDGEENVEWGGGPDMEEEMLEDAEGKKKKKKKKKGGMLGKLFGSTVKMIKKSNEMIKKTTKMGDKKPSRAGIDANGGSVHEEMKEDLHDNRRGSSRDLDAASKGGIELNLRFTGDINFLASPVSSETIIIPSQSKDATNMEIEWDNELVPAIVPLAGDFSYVRSQNILITIRMRREQDANFHKIGCAEISLSASSNSLPRMCVRQTSTPATSTRKMGSRQTSKGSVDQSFGAPLLCRGVQVGYIRGSVRLRNVVQPASSSLSKRWRRRSDMNFTSTSKKKFAELSRDSDDFEDFRPQQRVRSSGIVRETKSNNSSGSGEANGKEGKGGSSGERRVGGAGGRFQNDFSQMDDLDAWLAGPEEDEVVEEEEGDSLSELPSRQMQKRKVLKKSLSMGMNEDEDARASSLEEFQKMIVNPKKQVVSL